MSSGLPGFAINGFGRIGRTTLRVWYQKWAESVNKNNSFNNYGSSFNSNISHQPFPRLNAINTSGSMEVEDWAHLLKFDSNYGPWQTEVRVNRYRSVKEVSDEYPEIGTLELVNPENSNGEPHIITVTAQRDPAKIPWYRYDAETVVESTGAFTKLAGAALHFAGGAKTIILSAPAKSEGINTVVIGVNEPEEIKSKLNNHPQGSVISNASCTTNCIAPVAKIMVDEFGVEKALLTTVHAYTDDQNLQDNSHRDLRRARGAAQNIIPTSTGAAKAAALVIPQLQGKFDGLALRVPVATGSISDLTFVTSRETTVEEVNQVLQDAAKQPRWQGILTTLTEPLVSSDIIARPESSLVDLELTQVLDGNLVKIVAWYDNEWGYCNRMVDLVALVQA
jgi:glyceraldehyde 3-phosphate dehydrogenase